MNEMLAEVLAGGEREAEGAASMAAAHGVHKVEVGHGGGRPSIRQLGRRLRSVMAAVGHQSGSLAEGDHEFSEGAGGQCRRGGTKIGASGGGAAFTPWTTDDGPKLDGRRGQ